MRRPDTVFTGPLPIVPGDIPALNRLFSDAFTERYRRDGLTGVRVPFLNPVIWKFALAAAGDGALLWRDGRGEIVAFNLIHRSGLEGWMGPLAVRPDRQAGGLGRRIVEAGIRHLERAGATTIGLETMPRTVDNIGFYSRLGFLPGHLTITMQREALRSGPSGANRLSALSGSARGAVAEACRSLVDRLAPGFDFTREIDLTIEQAVGDVTLVRGAAGELLGFALWHSAPLVSGRVGEEIRILKLAATDLGGAIRVLEAVEGEARRGGMERITLRCQTSYPALYARLLADGFRVHWTDLRMTLSGHGEPPRGEGVLLSNWEI